MTRQCVWIVRYGKTKYPLVANKGPYDSDLDPTEGLEHAQCIAQRIANATRDAPVVFVYASPFQRTTHTAHVIAKACHQNNNNNTGVCMEPGLTEWQIPSLLVDEQTGNVTKPKSVLELKQIYDTVNVSYKSSSMVPHSDFVEESQEDLLKRCATTLQGILKQHHKHDDDCNIVIVSHAPCDQAMAYSFLTDSSSRDDVWLPPWAMGGITMFSRNNNNDKKWTMEMYSDTRHMPGEYKNGLHKWSLPMFEKGEIDKD